MVPDFDRAQNTATELLLTQQLDSFFIDVRKFRFERKIIIDSFQHYSSVVRRPIDDFICDEVSGCCVVHHHPSETKIVLYDNTEPMESRKHWGITHELGHIFLDHKQDDPNSEIEAHFFAAQVVCPEIVLIGLMRLYRSISYSDLTDRFNVTPTAAIKRINTLNNRHCYSYGDIDKRLFEKFLPIIKTDCDRKLAICAY